ncbi:MAG: DUF2726 domain-containing protein [Zoogloeaceae bacterium]|nr:DUF2726 domain-containing protein [Zoogloeaceae bacterium]
MALSAIMLIALIISTLNALKQKNQTTAPDDQYQYAPKRVMTDAEQILYYRLLEALPEYPILAQVQMSSFLYDKQKKSGWSALNQIRMKSVDFLVIRKDAYVVAVIELQDSTHERKDRQKNDEFKRNALKSAGIRLIEFHARELPSTEEIRAAIVI